MRSLPRRVITAAKPAYAPVRASVFGAPFWLPLGRWATEDEIAAPITFLLSDAASMISGVSLPIDGGYTCR